MTIIVWDGKTIAADKRRTCVGMATQVTKLRRLPSGDVVCASGDSDIGILLCDWYAAGASKGDWPEIQKTDDFAQLVVINRVGVNLFCRFPIPEIITAPYLAWGSGRDYAMGAMAMGADARRAVSVACQFDIHCGNGIDAVDIDPAISSSWAAA